MKRDPGGWQLRLDQEMIESYTRLGVWSNQTLADLARTAAACDPARVTHVFEGRPYEIGRLLADAETLAANLQARGLRTGDVVSFQLPNWIEAFLIDLAASMLGLVVAPIVPIYREAEAAYMLADCGAKVAFVPGEYRGYDYLSMMRRLAKQLPQLQEIVSVRVGNPVANNNAHSRFESLVANGAQLREVPNIDPNAVKLMLYTSGTTGKPKAVLHSHNTMAYTVRAAGAHWDLRPSDTMLMASPVTHITGFGAGLEMPLLCNVRTVFMERWDAAEGVTLIEREKVSISMGATPFLQELLDEAQRRASRLPSLRLYACGGAAVPPALIRRAHSDLDRCRAFRVFGSSEVPLTTLGFVGAGQLDLAAETDGEVVHYEVRVLDDEGRELSPGQEGELAVRGPAMFLGYADPAQTAGSFDADGYFLTGDVGHLTPQRAIVVTGRKKDLINRGGEKISAKEVEDLLHQHPSIAEAAVVAIPHARLGETVAAYAVLVPGATLEFEELIRHISAAGVARQKHPERLFIVDTFPRTASGKIRKDQLRIDARERLRRETHP